MVAALAEATDQDPPLGVETSVEGVVELDSPGEEDEAEARILLPPKVAPKNEWTRRMRLGTMGNDCIHLGQWAAGRFSIPVKLFL